MDKTLIKVRSQNQSLAEVHVVRAFSERRSKPPLRIGLQQMADFRVAMARIMGGLPWRGFSDREDSRCIPQRSSAVTSLHKCFVWHGVLFVPETHRKLSLQQLPAPAHPPQDLMAYFFEKPLGVEPAAVPPADRYRSYISIAIMPYACIWAYGQNWGPARACSHSRPEIPFRHGLQHANFCV